MFGNQIKNLSNETYTSEGIIYELANNIYINNSTSNIVVFNNILSTIYSDLTLYGYLNLNNFNITGASNNLNLDNKLIIDNDAIYPYSDLLLDLGKSIYRFDNLYVNTINSSNLTISGYLDADLIYNLILDTNIDNDFIIKRNGITKLTVGDTQLTSSILISAPSLNISGTAILYDLDITTNISYSSSNGNVNHTGSFTNDNNIITTGGKIQTYREFWFSDLSYNSGFKMDSGDIYFYKDISALTGEIFKFNENYFNILNPTGNKAINFGGTTSFDDNIYLNSNETLTVFEASNKPLLINTYNLTSTNLISSNKISATGLIKTSDVIASYIDDNNHIYLDAYQAEIEFLNNVSDSMVFNINNLKNISQGTSLFNRNVFVASDKVFYEQIIRNQGTYEGGKYILNLKNNTNDTLEPIITLDQDYFKIHKELKFEDGARLKFGSGFTSWTGSGNYYSVSGTTFSLLRGGTGYINDALISWSGSQNQTLTANEINYIYINSSGLIQRVGARTDDLYINNIVLFEVLYDGTNHIVVKENHPNSFPVTVSNDKHRCMGVSINNGGGNILLNGTVKVEISGASYLCDHGLDTLIPDSGGVAVSFNMMYTNASGKWIIYSTTDSFSSIYNNAGTITALDANKYGVYRLFVSKDDLNSSTPKYLAIIHNAQFNSSATAQASINSGSIQFPTNDLYDIELAQLGFVVFRQSTGQIDQVIISKQQLGVNFVSANSNQANLIIADTTSFNNILSSTDSNVQQALETIDNYTVSYITDNITASTEIEEPATTLSNFNVLYVSGEISYETTTISNDTMTLLHYDDTYSFTTNGDTEYFNTTTNYYQNWYMSLNNSSTKAQILSSQYIVVDEGSMLYGHKFVFDQNMVTFLSSATTLKDEFSFFPPTYKNKIALDDEFAQVQKYNTLETRLGVLEAEELITNNFYRYYWYGANTSSVPSVTSSTAIRYFTASPNPLYAYNISGVFTCREKGLYDIRYSSSCSIASITIIIETWLYLDQAGGSNPLSTGSIVRYHTGRSFQNSTGQNWSQPVFIDTVLRCNAGATWGIYCKSSSTTWSVASEYITISKLT